MYQEKLLQNIQAEIGDQKSLIEAVANALDISYDAAHRRVSMKSKLSIEEGVKLANQYHISLDRLFDMPKKNVVAVTKTKAITDEESLQTYFESSTISLTPLLSIPSSKILYSAKDIPLFYTLGGDLLSKFKFYVWLKLLDKKFNYKHFHEYQPHPGLIKSAKALGELYTNLDIIEIWDITSVNSTLKQINFYFQAGHINNTTALELCKAVKELILKLSVKVYQNNKYQLYYNELLLMNNIVMVTVPTQSSLFVPFTVLSYFNTKDKYTCKQAENYFNRQLQNSKLLNTSGERDRDEFFNKMINKIDALQQLIAATETLAFE
ncbi:MAG: hypothetical protein OIF50_01625 [Flavobacteriaceae bacterium]|nr:hypothetical protein [Flavobacteriaceae bacterium]